MRLPASLFERTPVAARVAVLALAAFTFACSPGVSNESQTQSTAQRAATTMDEPAPGGSPAQAQPIGFVVRFRPEHALGRAQTLEAAGRCEEAERLARQTIAVSVELRGLCFDRFTLGGAETVLTSCAPVPAARSAEYQRDWLARFRAMDGVEYADVNIVVQVSDCVGAQPR